MRTVAAVIDQGALTFDFAIPCEVFGLDRSDIVDPWYEFLVVAAGGPPPGNPDRVRPRGTARPRPAAPGGHDRPPGLVGPDRRAVRRAQGRTRRGVRAGR